MPIHVTDLPLEVVEITLILLLAVGLFVQSLALRRDKARSEKQLSQANDELKHLRRVIDRILMVDKGYSRPGEELGEGLDEAEEQEPRKHRPSRLP